VSVPLFTIIAIAILLIFVGTLLIFIDVLTRSVRGGGVEKTEKHVEAGGAIIIGPLPIVFGTSKRITKIVLILAIVLTVLAIVLTVLNYYLWVY